MLMLAACRGEKNIGVIGRADELTDIYENNEKSVKKPIRMIRVDGELYYDSGKVSDMTPRCGTMDGSLKSSTDEYTVPQEDGSCNFKNADGYQNGTEMTKEILIDGEWVIFKKIEELEKDILKYRYCYYLKGTMPNAESESELIVLANDKDLDFTKVTKSIYSSSLENFYDIYIVPI